jgi:hypothetical protein
MILPHTHASLAGTIFGIGSVIITVLTRPMTLSEIWIEFEKKQKTARYNCPFTYFMKAIYFLYTIGAIKLNSSKRIILCRT